MAMVVNQQPIVGDQIPLMLVAEAHGRSILIHVLLVKSVKSVNSVKIVKIV
jgi:hypothetical protein